MFWQAKKAEAKEVNWQALYLEQCAETRKANKGLMRLSKRCAHLKQSRGWLRDYADNLAEANNKLAVQHEALEEQYRELKHRMDGLEK